MVEPNFFIIGAAKSATTSLSSLLAMHPQAAMACPKEPHFFSYQRCYDLGWERYLSLYRHCVDQQAVGEASTSYSRVRYFPRVPDRIRQHVPKARIIYMVRHPLERMEAAYVEHLCTPGGRPFMSLNEAILLQPMILDSSRYWEVFESYRSYFDESQIKVVWFEEYVSDALEVFRDVCRFLQIDDSFVPDLRGERRNSRDDAGPRMAKLGRGDVRLNTNWDEVLRRSVIDQLRDDNTEFLRHLGRPLDYWGDLFC